MAPPRNQFLNAALAYAEMGWRVCPCDPRSKRPLPPRDKDPATGKEIENSGGIKKATTDVNVIRAWWTRWPKAMIAVALGEAGFVIDLDAGTDEKTDTVYTNEQLIAVIEAEVGCAIPADTVTAASPRGGRHVWLKPPAGEPMPGNPKLYRAADDVKLERIDIKGTGGYVIVPPSVRHDGKHYEWLRSPRAFPIAECPAALLDAILRRGKWDRERGRAPQGGPSRPAETSAAAEGQSAAAQPPRRAISPPRAAAPASGENPRQGPAGGSAEDALAAYAQTAFDAELAAVAAADRAGRERNNTISSAAIKLGQLIGAGVLAEADVRAALYEFVDRWPQRRKTAASVESGLAKGIASPRDLTEIELKAAERAAVASERRAYSDSVPDPDQYGDASLSPRRPPHPQEGENEKAETLNQDGKPSSHEAAADDVAPEKPAALALIEALKDIATLVERETYQACALLDTSDSDNAKRLLAYMGDDLLVRAEDEIAAGTFLVWTGQHWDVANGAAGVSKIGQRIGDLIKLEADYIEPTKGETERIGAGKGAKIDLDALAAKDDLDDADRVRMDELAFTVKAGLAAQAALYKRRSDRRNKHAVGTKNSNRINNMTNLAAPYLRRAPDAFNPDPFVAVTRSHTLRFVREAVEAPEPDEPKFRVHVDAKPRHVRADMVTALVPVDYDPKATCPRWLANIEKFQPDPAQRRTVQAYSGIGLTGAPIQRVMYHYGVGGNFKSVFLETLVRVLGDSYAVGLPASAVSGFATPGTGNAPTPELARLYGKRMLRVLELPVDQPLKADLIKKLTGGERFPVRTLFKGFFELMLQATAHMSGNGLPKFDGSDGGMRRRMLAVEWPIALPLAEQRDFEEVVREQVAEAPGILNWLIAGTIDYLTYGLVVAKHIMETTQEYIDENDPVGQFDRACVEAAPGETVGARLMWESANAWFKANGLKEMSETMFGRIMPKKRDRVSEHGRRFYREVRLHDVPAIERSGGEPPPPLDGMEAL